MLRWCILVILISTVFSKIQANKNDKKIRHMTGLEKPHIVMIVIDDLGWNDVSFHGSPQIPTPNIDALAVDGTVLTNYYVMPICTPSRSALLSGYYPIHTGLQHDVIYGEQGYGLPLNFTLLPEHLKRQGYATHAIGKWHLGFFQKEYTPTYRGFNSHYGYWLGHESYFDHTGLEGDAYGLDFRDNLDPVWDQGGRYATEIFTDKAVNLIHRHNTSQPLFLYLAHLAVHGGNSYSVFESPAKYSARFPHIQDIKRRLFAGMVSAVDDSVGEVIRALSEARMLQNTLVIVTTDNGGAAGGIDASKGSNFPLRGSKYTLWQGGVRGTALLWYPKLKGGSVRNQLMHISDWMPTLYRAAGGSVSDLGPIDGVDMWNSLIKDSPSPRDEVLLNIDPLWKVAALISGKHKIISGFYPGHVDSWYGPSGRDPASMAVMTKLPVLTNSSLVAQTLRKIGRYFVAPCPDWYRKFNVTCSSPPIQQNTCMHPENQPCLFDVENDPCEYNNLASSLPKLLDDLVEKLKKYNSTAVPPANKPEDPRADPKNFGFLWSSWE